jgi:cephalosporin hydroxylase
MTLKEILSNYPDTDKSTWHSYDSVYEYLFEPLRDKVTSVLEIGVRGGGSLLAWRDYFPNAKVYGIDNGSEAGMYEPTDSRIKVLWGDSCKPETLTSIALDYGPFDIIIEDGLHRPETQIATFAALRGFLNTDGIYVIEDIEDISFAQNIQKFFGGEIFDRRDVKGRHDDILLVFDTRDNTGSIPNKE